MDRHALERLGHYVVSRRVALGYRNRTDLANSLKFTVRTLADIEHGVRMASPGTYLRHLGEHAFLGAGQHRHHPGGRGTPRTRGQAASHHQQPASPHRHRSPSRASNEELLLELRRRIIAPRDRRSRNLGRLGRL